MRVLLQRVSRAEVRVNGQVSGAIGRGLLALLGVEKHDTPADAAHYATRTAEIRLFPDEHGRMNRDVLEAGGAVLVVSQFTLAASTRRGRRPSFDRAAPPERAEPIYESFLAQLRGRGVSVASGVFGAMMDVELVNDGPVTLMLDPRSTEAP